MLPLGADSEMAFRQREEWTFAVFVAALGDSIDVTVRFAVIKALLPLPAYAWLHRNAPLFSLWERYLHGDVSNNVLAELIRHGHETLHIKATQEEIAVIPKPNQFIETQQNTQVQPALAIRQDDVNPAIETMPVDLNREPHDTSANKATEIKEIDLKALSNPTHQESHVDHLKDKAIIVSEPKATHQAGIPNFDANDFWHWLKSIIHEKAIIWNKTTSFIHGVDLGLLIQIPEAIDHFLKDQAKKHTAVPEDRYYQQRSQLTKYIKKYDKLIKNTRGSRIHVYCVGKWENRQTISGIVIEQEFLMTDNQKVPVNAQLAPDPLDSL